MKRIAILGAGGFVGSRMVEMSILGRAFEAVPIIRSAKGAARLARFGPIWRFADAAKAEELKPVIAGCDAVVNLTVGAFDKMAATAEAVWQACAAAGVSKLIHMSTAEVFGRVEDEATTDDSPCWRKHWMPYAVAKAAAEDQLRGHFSDRKVAVTILRPGLIWGVRSPWVEGPAADMVAGRAYLINGGQGVCNLINVDNLIEQVLLVAGSANQGSGCYNVADDEALTWQEYYEALAKEIGVPMATVHQVNAPIYRPTTAARFADFKQTAPMQWLKARLSRPMKLKLKSLLAVVRPKPVMTGPVPKPGPLLTRGGWHQQNVRHRLSNRKFRKVFGRGDEMSFRDAMALTGMWLRSCGFAEAGESFHVQSS